MAKVTLKSVVVYVSDMPGGVNDWIGLYRIGAAHSAWSSWQRMNGTKTAPRKAITAAILTVALPGPGPWELRAFSGAGTGTPLGIYPLLQPLSGVSNELTAVGA
jgi:hypothetical protein